MTDEKRSILIAASLFILILALSLIFYLTAKGGRVERHFFFPNKMTNLLVGEERQIAKKETLQDDIHEYLDELLLGPANPYSTTLFPLKTRLYSVLLDEKTLYINFSKEFLFQNSKKMIPYNLIYKAIYNNILFNFKSINEIKIAVIGREPYVFAMDRLQSKSSLSKTRFYEEILY
ncbi:MAG: GerMN domain-containing protein [Spirochaetales bacterium]|nr:GerMN domain-containing protein [Spirochaetales bacterium]